MDHFVSLGREANEQQRRQSFYILLYILLYIYIRVNKHTLMEAVQNYTRFDTPKTFASLVREALPAYHACIIGPERGQSISKSLGQELLC